MRTRNTKLHLEGLGRWGDVWLLLPRHSISTDNAGSLLQQVCPRQAASPLSATGPTRRKA